jgi:hypothetical protein
MDGALIEFKTAASSSGNIAKAVNSGENFSILRDGKNLIVASLPMLRQGDTVQLRLWNTTARDYRIQVRSNGFTGAGQLAILVDRFLKKQTTLNLGDAITPYDFTINADQGSKDPLRFYIVVSGSLTLPEPAVTRLTAEKKPGGVELSWQVDEEQGIVRYEVEKSTDGTTFKPIAEVRARLGAGPQTYVQFDNRTYPLIHYRIRVIGSNGETRYSNMVTVEYEIKKEAVVVYPNPVTENTFQLQLVSKPAGTYFLTLHSNQGQLVLQQTIQHAGGDATFPVSFASAVAAGNYMLEVKNERGRRERVKISVVR